jgi:hypothetical protein
MGEDDKHFGLYKKFEVQRVDGQSAPGLKHDGCEYFVIDLTHDEFAGPAILAYGLACAEKYPYLSSDLVSLARNMAMEEQRKKREERGPRRIKDRRDRE